MNKYFIGIDENIKPPYKSTSLLLRRTFNIKNINHRFYLEVIGLGIAVYYLNGQRVTDGVLCTTNSDYSKTIYLDQYDVTSLIKKGKNVIAVELGNGFYNESIETVWKINHAHWRGEKCLYLKLKADNRTIIRSDEQFKVQYSPYLTYNELRAGECFDSREFIEFYSPNFDDSNWGNAVYVSKQPQGTIILNKCPQIREFLRQKPVKTLKNSRGYVFDFGKNMSGYVEARVSTKPDKEITFRYAEDIDDKNELDLHGLDCYQKGEPFQTDKCISNGKPFVFKPKFTYHGFRFVEVSGVDDINDIFLNAIFVHQDIKYLKPKALSNGLYQQIFDCGINSLLSNMYYGLTDCPTREKLNWLNDFEASLPVLIKYFDCRELLKKIYKDILDSQTADGNVPGIAPSPNWGYEFGPLCSGVMILLPYLYYEKYNDKSLFDKNLPQIKRYYRFVKKNINSNYFFLGDWTGSTNHKDTPVQFVLETYMFSFDQILFEMTGDAKYQKDLNVRKKILESYELKGQGIPSTLLVLNIGNKKKNLDVLLKSIEDAGYHFDGGIFTFKYLFKALSISKRDDLIEKIVCNKTAPSFKVWIDSGATTLYETFSDTWSLSMNHHMFANVIIYLK